MSLFTYFYNRHDVNKYFESPLCESDSKSIYVGIKTRYASALASVQILAKKLFRTSEEMQFVQFSEAYNQENQIHSKSIVTKIHVNDLVFEKLIQKRYESILRKSVAAFVQKKLDSGEWSSLATGKGYERFSQFSSHFAKRASGQAPIAREVIKKAPIEKILSSFSEEEKNEILFATNEEEWASFFSGIYQFLRAKINRMNDVCARQFLSLFERKELQQEGAWKIPLAFRTVEAQHQPMPEFYRSRFALLRKDLPENYDEKAALWKKKQAEILNVSEQLMHLIEDLCSPNITKQMKHYLKLFQGEVKEICEDVAESVILPKYAEFMNPSCEYDMEINLYTHHVIEALTVRDIWETMKDIVSEDMFLRAYQKWGKFSLIPSEMEELVYYELFMDMWRNASDPYERSDVEFDAAFKIWKKQEDRSIESFEAFLPHEKQSFEAAGG